MSVTTTEQKSVLVCTTDKGQYFLSDFDCSGDDVVCYWTKNFDNRCRLFDTDDDLCKVLNKLYNYLIVNKRFERKQLDVRTWFTLTVTV